MDYMESSEGVGQRERESERREMPCFNRRKLAKEKTASIAFRRNFALSLAHFFIAHSVGPIGVTLLLMLLPLLYCGQQNFTEQQSTFLPLTDQPPTGYTGRLQFALSST